MISERSTTSEASDTAPTVFVTGATGITGQATVHALRGMGVKVIAGVHSTDKAGPLRELGADVRRISFFDVAGMREAMLGAAGLFLVTPVTQETEKLTASIVEAAKAAGVAHIVKLSGLGVDSDPGFTLGHWHHAAEEVIEASRLKWTFLRPNAFMQNFLGNAESIKGQGTYHSPFGDTPVSFIDARDIGEVAARVLTTDGHAGKTYNLTGPKGITNAEVAELFTRATGKAITCVDVTVEQLRQGLLGYGMPEAEASATAELLGVIATGTAADTAPDAERLLGRSPRKFAQFLGDYGAAFSAVSPVAPAPEAITRLTTLDPAASYVTLINTYTVAPERAEELLDFLTRSTEGVLRHVPGFISANLHLSLDRTKVVNYAQWTSTEATAAARTNPKVAALMREQLRIAESFTPIPYELRRSLAAWPLSDNEKSLR